LLTGSGRPLVGRPELGRQLGRGRHRPLLTLVRLAPVDPKPHLRTKKIEFFSSGSKGGLILVAAGGIAWYAGQRLAHPPRLEGLGAGLLLSLAASLINLASPSCCAGLAGRHNSIVLEAERVAPADRRLDLGGGAGGLGLVWLTGGEFLDPLARWPWRRTSPGPASA